MKSPNNIQQERDADIIFNYIKSAPPYLTTLSQKVNWASAMLSARKMIEQMLENENEGRK